MVTKQKAPQVEYQLKHRLTGAGILILSAIVIIPLLLKEPANVEASIELSSTKQQSDQQNDEAFVSKIIPLTEKKRKKKSASAKVLRQSDGIEEGESFTGQAVPEDQLPKPALIIDDEELVSINSFTNNSESDKDSSATVSENQQTPEQVQDVVMTADPEDITAEQAPVEDPAPVADKDSTEGWTVRVGTFSKSENVDTVSSLLNDSGFNARHTKVQTTLGEAIRVWLGPYASKEMAEKVSVRLKSLTGEKGYITRHAS